MSVHRLVQLLLPSEPNVSHHLVPKTEEQRKATRILLDMTGKRREIINLNGSGIDDPQAQSLLSRIARGDEDVSLLDYTRLPRRVKHRSGKQKLVKRIGHSMLLLTNITQDKHYRRQTKIAEIILICHRRWLTQAHLAKRSTCLLRVSFSRISPLSYPKADQR